jgi:hypothetical protein
MPWHNSRDQRTLFNFALVFDQIVKPDSDDFGVQALIAMLQSASVRI